MSGMEAIVAKILNDAQKEAQGTIDDAKAKAEGKKAELLAKLEKEKAASLKNAEQLAAERGARIVSSAELEAKKMQLAAKRSVIDEAFDLAMKRLCELPAEEYFALLLKLSSSVTGSGEELVLNPKDREAFGEKLVSRINDRLAGKGKVALSNETVKAAGGVIIKSENAEINSTFEAIVKSLLEELVPQIAKVLF